MGKESEYDVTYTDTLWSPLPPPHVPPRLSDLTTSLTHRTTFITTTHYFWSPAPTCWHHTTYIYVELVYSNNGSASIIDVFLFGKILNGSGIMFSTGRVPVF